MALYHLDYDLHRERDYEKLHTELHRLGATHIALSKWEFNFEPLNCDMLLQHFSKFVDGDDTIIVSQIVKSVSKRPIGLLGKYSSRAIAAAVRRFGEPR